MRKDKGLSGDLDKLQAKVDAVIRLQAETQAELDALLPAVLDRAFRGGSCRGVSWVARQSAPDAKAAEFA